MQIGIAKIYIDNSLNVRDDIIWDAVDTYAEIFDQLPDITVFDVEPPDVKNCLNYLNCLDCLNCRMKPDDFVLRNCVILEGDFDPHQDHIA